MGVLMSLQQWREGVAKEDKEKSGDKEVQKEVIQEKTVCSSRMVDGCRPRFNLDSGSFALSQNFVPSPDLSRRNLEKVDYGLRLISEPENAKDTASSRRLRIQNIFTLCGNYRELSQHTTIPIPAKKRFEDFDPDSSPVRTIGEDSTVQKSFNEISQLHESVAADPLASNKLENKQKLTQPQIHNIRDSDERVLESKENFNPEKEITGDQVEVYVKWEASKENPGKFISILNVAKDSTLADLRKLIEIHLGADKQAFTFLVFGDPTGAPVPREKEATLQPSKLPICNNQLGSHLACLRPVKGSQCPNHIPFSPLENKLPGTPNSHLMQQGDGFSPKIAQHLSSTPFITVRRY